MSKSLQVTHLLKHMRVVEKLIREKFKMGMKEWEEAWREHGPIVLDTEVEDVGESDFEQKDCFESLNQSSVLV